MSVTDNPQANLSLVPLGAGDLIDRSVRFYRKFFWTFILIAAPPVIVGTLILVVWSFVGRQLFGVDVDWASPTGGSYILFIWFGGMVIWLTQTVATLVVMGGASRNFVRHLLFGEAITWRETYRNAWKRLSGLVVASSIITFILGMIGMAILTLGMTVAVVAIALAAAVFSFIPVVAFIVSLALGLASAFGTLWLFFLAASRVAYVPQVMMVEGQGVIAAIGRSATLASGNVRRLAALFIFSTAAAYSALAILYVPLAWYASANGVEITGFGGGIIPAWYEIASNLIWQISLILLSPVWMIGLCLLYVDDRVRSEGYDIELMAASRLGEIPAVPRSYVNPLQPALASPPANGTRTRRSSLTSLGLE